MNLIKKTHSILIEVWIFVWMNQEEWFEESDFWKLTNLMLIKYLFLFKKLILLCTHVLFNNKVSSYKIKQIMQSKYDIQASIQLTSSKQKHASKDILNQGSNNSSYGLRLILKGLWKYVIDWNKTLMHIYNNNSLF